MTWLSKAVQITTILTLKCWLWSRTPLNSWRASIIYRIARAHYKPLKLAPWQPQPRQSDSQAEKLRQMTDQHLPVIFFVSHLPRVSKLLWDLQRSSQWLIMKDKCTSKNFCMVEQEGLHGWWLLTLKCLSLRSFAATLVTECQQCDQNIIF